MTRFIALEGRTMYDYSCSRRSFLGLAGGLAAFAGLGLAGCGGSDAPAAGSADAPAGVVGEVTYDGASSFQALVEAAAEQFMNENPDCVVSGSGNEMCIRDRLENLSVWEATHDLSQLPYMWTRGSFDAYTMKIGRAHV